MKKHGVRVGDAAVKTRTGKTWAQWFQILDKAGAKKLNHTQIATLLHGKFKFPGWWCQMIAVAYEQSRGLRKLHQHGKTFTATLGRTFACNASKLFSACKDLKRRRAWLKNDKFAISSTQLNKSLRGVWDGESRLVKSSRSPARRRSLPLIT